MTHCSHSCEKVIIHCILNTEKNAFRLFLFQLLANSQGQISIAAMNTVAEVLHKLLVVGITDTGEWEEGVIINVGH